MFATSSYKMRQLLIHFFIATYSRQDMEAIQNHALEIILTARQSSDMEEAVRVLTSLFEFIKK